MRLKSGMAPLANPSQASEPIAMRPFLILSSDIGWHRAVCDYISGMTDRYAIQDYERLFGPPIPARRRSRPAT